LTRGFPTFACEGATLHATLDPAAGATGLLIVSGGNEIRAGTWAGQAQLAARIAARGFPTLRFDRRGVGDSDGPNLGFRHSAPDIRAAIAAFRAAQPHLTHIAALGNCDAASALMLANGAGADALILANPWTFADDDGAARPVQALRAHYRQRLANRAALARLLTGKISLPALIASLRRTLAPAPPPSALAQDIANGLARFAGQAALLIAERDRTGQAFLGTWNKGDPRLRICPGASHSFVEPESQVWLENQIIEMLEKM
jgi:exosortase A-associated hydrolase 1